MSKKTEVKNQGNDDSDAQEKRRKNALREKARERRKSHLLRLKGKKTHRSYAEIEAGKKRAEAMRTSAFLGLVSANEAYCSACTAFGADDPYVQRLKAEVEDARRTWSVYEERER